MGITHAKVSAKSDGVDTSLVRPTDWNADHLGGVTAEEFAALEARVVALEGGGSPPPYGRPFAAPVTTATYTVPGTITHDGTADASTDLNAWISGTVPDGSIINFAIPGANYRLDVGIYLSGRENIVLEGNGTTTLTLNGAGNNYYASAFVLTAQTNHVAIHGFNILGPDTGWPTVSGENQHVLTVLGWYNPGPCSYIEMSAVTGGRVHGDFVYIEGSNGGLFPPSTYVWIHHNNFDYCGRNGVSFINSQYVWVEYNTLNHMNYHAFDFEPNAAAESNTDVIVRNNTVGSYAHRSGLIGYFIAATMPGDLGQDLTNVTIKDNTVTGIAANGYNGTPLGLNTAFWGTTVERWANVVFTGNSSTQTVSGYAIVYFAYIDGVTCTGNTQPMSSGTFVVASNCTSTVLTPNTTT